MLRVVLIVSETFLFERKGALTLSWLRGKQLHRLCQGGRRGIRRGGTFWLEGELDARDCRVDLERRDDEGYLLMRMCVGFSDLELSFKGWDLGFCRAVWEADGKALKIWVRDRGYL